MYIEEEEENSFYELLSGLDQIELNKAKRLVESEKEEE